MRLPYSVSLLQIPALERVVQYLCLFKVAGYILFCLEGKGKPSGNEDNPSKRSGKTETEVAGDGLVGVEDQRVNRARKEGGAEKNQGGGVSAGSGQEGWGLGDGQQGDGVDQLDVCGAVPCLFFIL